MISKSSDVIKKLFWIWCFAVHALGSSKLLAHY